MLLGGDFVDRGDPSLLEETLKQIGSIRASISSSFPESKIAIACVPGNHDHDFSGDLAARDAIIKTLSVSGDQNFEPSIVDILLQTQKGFFTLRETIQKEFPLISYSLSIDKRIIWRHEIVGEQPFEIHCYNTSLFSQTHESQGHLFVPAKEQLEDPRPSIGLMHHPLSWLEPWNSKELRKSVFDNHLILFTGHEHKGDSITSTLGGSGTTLIVEAPLFWDHKSENEQGFSAVYYDFSNNDHIEYKFVWEGKVYTPYSDNQKIAPNQPQLPLKRLSEINKFSSRWRFEDEFAKELESTNLLITHSRRGNINLGDIFVYPDVRELTPESNYNKSKLILGKNILELLLTRRVSFIVGADQSGKTGLAKTLMKDLLDGGYIPILIDGTNLPSQPEKYREFLSDLCTSQYGEYKQEHYSNAPLEEKVIIVDNYHLSPKSARKSHRVLEMMDKNCSRLIILGKDAALSPTDLATFAIDSKFSISVINTLPFSRELQKTLVRKWISLDAELDSDSPEFSQKEVEALRLMSGMVGSGYIQAFPSYLIAILQSAEAGNPVDVTASTHGHLYEAFITAALSKRRSLTNHSILTSFTAFLAYSSFKEDLPEFGEDYLVDIHERWKEEADSNRSLTKLKSELINLRFLTDLDRTYKFSEKFISYYFSALYLKDHLSSPECQKIILECIEKIWVEDYANTLLFLAHLSKDSFVIKNLVAFANKSFSEFEAAELRGRLLLNENYNLPEDDNKASQWIEAQTRDDDLNQVAQENQIQKMPVSLDRNSKVGDLDFIGHICANLKTMQILGQFVKNFPASFSPSDKTEIVEGCVSLGLRTLGAYLKIVEDEQKEIIQDFAEILTGQKTALSKDQAVQGARVALTNLCQISSFGVIKRISIAIGSSELENNYGRVFSDNDPPSRKLVELSLKLDHAGTFPEQKVRAAHLVWRDNDQFACQILRGLIGRHLRLFDVPLPIRQRTGELLNLPKNVISPPINREKLVTKKK